jgi:hypothetical protein
MNLQEAKEKFLGKKVIIHWSKLPGFDRKGATVPQDTEATITDVFQLFDDRIVFLSDKTFTPFNTGLLTLE